MSDSEKTIRIRNTKTGVETTMLVDRWKLRNQRLQREGWVVVDPEELGIEVKAPAKMTTEERVEKAQKDMGVKAEKAPEPPKDDNQPDEVVEKMADETHSFEDMELSELKAYADENGIKYAKNAGKKKMIEILSK